MIYEIALLPDYDARTPQPNFAHQLLKSFAVGRGARLAEISIDHDNLLVRPTIIAAICHAIIFHVFVKSLMRWKN